MKMNDVMKKLNFFLDKEELRDIEIKVKDFTETLRESIRKKRIDAEAFIGGSFAKGTLAKSEEYDVDVFVRFNWKYEDLSYELEGILNKLTKEKNMKIDRMHGSRDYFRIYKDRKLTFEIVPVVKIKKNSEARNVTDLSYFHVNYVKRNLGEKMRKEVLLLKKFFKAAKVYGAESYINGFSGYGAECLIIAYKSFEKTLKELLKVKENERIILDPRKHYKNKNEVFIKVNENKMRGPVILIDPTWKERNVLSALNWETFNVFQRRASAFLKSPSEKYFYLERFDKDKLKELAKKKNASLLKINLETDRQEGDIAGTKLKKFSKFLLSEIRKYFDILEEDFEYEGNTHANFYVVCKSKREYTKIGPPLERKDDVKAFKKANKNTFEKNGFVHSLMKIDFSVEDFLKRFASKEKDRKLVEMGITGMRIEK